MARSFDARAVVFAFAPGDHVTVTHLALGYKGRVTRSILTANAGLTYEVEYNADGELKIREFFEDEIEARGKESH